MQKKIGLAIALALCALTGALVACADGMLTLPAVTATPAPSSTPSPTPSTTASPNNGSTGNEGTESGTED